LISKTDTDTGSQLQEKLRTWLSPPDPSINHRTARNIQHRGSATWFFQSNAFHEWKKNGSLLWIRGHRKFLLPFWHFLKQQFIPFPILQRDRGKPFFGT